MPQDNPLQRGAPNETPLSLHCQLPKTPPREKPSSCPKGLPLMPAAFLSLRFGETYRRFGDSGNKATLSLNSVLSLNWVLYWDSQSPCSIHQKSASWQSQDDIHYLWCPEQNENTVPLVGKVLRISSWPPQSMRPNTGLLCPQSRMPRKLSWKGLWWGSTRRPDSRVHLRNNWAQCSTSASIRAVLLAWKQYRYPACSQHRLTNLINYKVHRPQLIINEWDFNDNKSLGLKVKSTENLSSRVREGWKN